MDEYTKKIIFENFGEADYELALSVLESITLKHVMANSEAQLEDAREIILRECKGDLNALGQLVDLAKLDIRDILVRRR